MAATKVEFTVEVPRGQNIEAKIRQSLQTCSAALVEVNPETGRVVVESQSPWPELLTKIEDTGLRAALTGFGGTAAVSIVDKESADESIKGVIRFTSPEPDDKQLVVDGVIDGLQPNTFFQIQIHKCGDLSRGCESVGDMYGHRLIGQTKSSSEGRLTFRSSNEQFAISDLIGRSVVVADENQERLACGIIARAAGTNQNFKRICACDGINLWDERNVPLTGGARTTFTKNEL